MRPAYYSQNGEDYLLWQVLGPDRRQGYFVDVGAFDGVHLSNSYSFEVAGWTGICVEAHPDFFPLLQANRPKSRCIHAACVEETSASRVEFLAEPLGLLSGIRADLTSGMDRRYAARGMTFPGFSKISVPAASLNSVLREVNAPPCMDFLSLDVEGTEHQVLAGLNLSEFSFRLILTEANTADALAKTRRLLERSGYTCARSLGVNHLFAANEDDARLAAAVRIACRIEETLHPLGEHATLPTTRGRNVADP
jgi:FkbM family methyltransferase